jgi:hypothetical protein
VGDSGIEPLTSSASRKYDALQMLSGVFKTPANRHILQDSTFPKVSGY